MAQVAAGRRFRGKWTIFNGVNPVYYFTDVLQFLSYLSILAAGLSRFQEGFVFSQMSTRIAVSFLMLAGTIGSSHAQQRPTGGPNPSPPGASVYFVGIKDGQTVPTTFTVNFGLKGMGVAPAGSDKANSGHHHLLIDTELPPMDQPIPSDFNHLHFGAGQTEAEVTLPEGEHTLQLVLGDKDHIPNTIPLISERIKVRVVAGAPSTPVASAAPAAQPPAETDPAKRTVRTVGPTFLPAR